jgi:transposase
MVNYIGLDAHSKTCTFVVVNKEGHEITKCKVETSEKYLLGFLRSLKGKKKLVLEESSISQWLYLLLKKEVDEITVCNPTYLAKKQGAKNDYKDGLHLANELRCNHVVKVFHDDGPLIRMRSIVSSYSDVVTDCTRAKNRYKAIFRSKGIKVGTQKSFYKEIDVLKQLEYEEDQFVAKSLFELIGKLENQKLEFQIRFNEYKKNNQIIKNISTIPGIGPVRAVPLAAILCSAERFDNKHKLWSYAMLVKHFDESDGVIYGVKTKFGRIELKSIYIGAAESILRTNSSLRKYYDKLRSKGLDHKKARKAVARRIAAISLQIMKRGIKYDDKFIEKRNRKLKS